MINSNIRLSAEEFDKRIDNAVNYFKQGYNCSQSVVAAFADLYGLKQDLALKVASSFGGGIGRMRETCGAACGLFMLIGLDCGSTDGKDNSSKSHNYAMVQKYAQQFKEQNGSIICAELLGLKERPISPQAETRTKEYYKKRPCVEMVRCAAKLFREYLQNEVYFE